jgi:hypothetical protein
VPRSSALDHSPTGTLHAIAEGLGPLFGKRLMVMVNRPGAPPSTAALATSQGDRLTASGR